MHHYFHDADAQLTAVANEVEARLYPDPPPLPRKPAELPVLVRAVYQFAEDQLPLLRALVRSSLGPEVRARRRAVRLDAIWNVLEGTGACQAESRDAIAMVLGQRRRRDSRRRPVRRAHPRRGGPRMRPGNPRDRRQPHPPGRGATHTVRQVTARIPLRALARKGGHAVVMNDIENDRRTPSKTVPRRIAAELDLEAELLLGAAGWPTRGRGSTHQRESTARVLLRRMSDVGVDQQDVKTSAVRLRQMTRHLLQA